VAILADAGSAKIDAHIDILTDSGADGLAAAAILKARLFEATLKLSLASLAASSPKYL
jgi:hypothetical protein